MTSLKSQSIEIDAHHDYCYWYARFQVQNLIHDIIEYSREREPGVVKYAVCLPDNDPPSTTKDDTSVYIIEEWV